MMNTIDAAMVQPSEAQLIIAGSHRLYREAIIASLQPFGFSFVAEANTVRSSCTALDLDAKPDLLIYILGPDGMDAASLSEISEARSSFPSMRTIVLGDVIGSPSPFEAVQIGVEAWLSKDITTKVLQRSIELVLLGQSLFTAPLVQSLLSQGRMNADVDPPLATQPPPAYVSSDRAPSVLLSAREHQILRCLIDGLSNKVIARELDIAEATVKVHVKGLLRKTQMANRTQAAVWAMNHGLGMVLPRRLADPPGTDAIFSEAQRNGRTEPMVPQLKPAFRLV